MNNNILNISALFMKSRKRRMESEDDVDLYLSNSTNMTSTADVGTVDAVACSVNAAAEILSCKENTSSKV